MTHIAQRLAESIGPDLMTGEDVRLMDRLTNDWPDFQNEAVDAARLAEISHSIGIDAATALFYLHLCDSPENRTFLEALCGRDLPLGPQAPPARAHGPKILIAPAALYREFPSYRGDGALVREAAAAAGLRSEIIPTGSTSGVRANAEIIAEFIDREPEPKIILASMSKGGADARYAFEAGWIPEGRIQSWLQICGTIHGSPLANEVLHHDWLRRALVNGYLKVSGGSTAMVSDLAHGEPTVLSAPAISPPGVTVVNFLGFPMRRHLTGSSRKRHARLEHHGPNDGMLVLADSILRPGIVCPIWGANHHFHVPNLERLLARALLVLDQQSWVEEIVPDANQQLCTSVEAR